MSGRRDVADAARADEIAAAAATGAPPPPRPPRFYRRKRFWFWSGGAVVLLGLLLLLALYWLLSTVAGRDVLLAQIIARLPEGSALRWERAEGPLSGPLTLHGVDFRYGEIRFTADRAYLEPDLRPLLGRKLRLDRLELQGAALTLAGSDEPFELPRWPDVMPDIAMPLAIQADRIAIDGFRVSQGGEPVIDVRRARGGLEIATGVVHAEQLLIESDRGRFTLHGDYVPRADYRADLVATAVLPAPPGTMPASFGLAARGDLARMDVAVAGRAPSPLRAALVLRGQDAPDWRFDAASEGLQPALLTWTDTGGATAIDTGGEPIVFDLRTRGDGGAARLEGELRQGDFALAIAPSRIGLHDQVLTVEPLVLELLEGRVSLRGTADFNVPENPSFRFAVNARELQWGAEDAQTPIGARADFGFAGQLNAWAAIGEAQLDRGGERATLRFDGRGDAERMELRTLQARMPSGTLDATGSVAWVPTLAWDVGATLAGFDPGYFAAGWNGRVSGRFSSRGQAREAGGIDATLEVPELTGRLRDRPLDARGRFALHGDAGEGSLALSLGGSRLRAEGRVGATLAIDAELQPLQLADLVQDGGGTLVGSVKLSGRRDAPDIDADLTGADLKWGEWGAGTLALAGRLPWRNGEGQLSLRAEAVQAGLQLDRVQAQLRGAIERLQFDAEAGNELGAVALAGALRRRGAGWEGDVGRLHLAPARGDAWDLRQPAAFTVRGARWTLSDTCLSPALGGALCASADWPRQGLTLRGDALPLSLVQPWLPPNAGRTLRLRGDLTLDASLKPSGAVWEGAVHVASLEGGLRLGDNTRRELIRYDNFTIDADFGPERIRGRLGTGFNGDGYIDATVDTGWDAASPLSGDLYLHMSRLVWMELFSPDLVGPSGVLAGHVGLAGTRGQPLLSGSAQLTGFSGEFPALGLEFSEGRVDFDALADGSARIVGAVKSGEGVLNVDGSLGWDGGDTPLTLQVTGERVLVADTPELRAVATPNLVVTTANKTLQVRGEVEVPSANIDLERLDQGVSASADVVVLDPADPEEAPASPLDLELTLSLGDDVHLKGFGLEGTLQGELRVRARPGAEMRATGALEVGGRYSAYGQKLQITRGGLSWSNSIVSDPVLNLRAEREVGDVTAGIDVTGRATDPRAQVWSDPTMQESEALAYLAVGRSLSTLSSGEGEQITAASAALSAGSGLLASQLGTRLGLDDAGMMQSRALGGSVFGVGKYLSPKLYVGYGVSMVGAGQALTLKYLLRKGFDVEIESSSIENRASINYRHER